MKKIKSKKKSGGGTENFYRDDDGNKKDADLYPEDESEDSALEREWFVRAAIQSGMSETRARQMSNY